MNFSNLCIKKISQLLSSKSVTALDVQNHFLTRIENTKALNLFVTETATLCSKQSSESHERYQKNAPISELDGIPFAVKDNFCTEHVKTTCGSKMLEMFIPTYNATVVEKLLSHGSSLLGKTNMDEFGMGSGTVDSIFGPSKNPWDSNRITGGSSGGSAGAVAAGCCSFAIGSDTGGSIRNPASYCGVVGFKPSYGLVSRHGLIPLVNSMDVPGILTRTVQDCLTVFNAIAGPDPNDSTTINRPFNRIEVEPSASINGVRIGIPKEYNCDGLDGEILEMWTAVANAMETDGATVAQLSMPNTWSSIFVYSILNQCEVSSNMSRYDGIEYGYRNLEEKRSTEALYELNRAESLSEVVKNRILCGNYFLLRQNYDKYFEKALKVRRMIYNDFNAAFNNVDILLTPTTLSAAPLQTDFNSSSNRDQSAVQDYFTQPANMAGVPAISIPIKLSRANGLPLSLQLMAKHSNEQMLFTVAQWLENAVQFNHLE